MSAALALGGLPPERRLRVSLAFAAAETAMPVAGLAVGSLVGGRIGAGADYAAAAIVVAAGLMMLREGEEPPAAAARAHGLRLAALALGVSVDELAIGLSLGLLGAPIAVAIVAIGVQAFAAAQLGQRIGARAGTRLADRAEQLAGAALILLGVGFAAARIV